MFLVIKPLTLLSKIFSIVLAVPFYTGTVFVCQPLLLSQVTPTASIVPSIFVAPCLELAKPNFDVERVDAGYGTVDNDVISSCQRFEKPVF